MNIQLFILYDSIIALTQIITGAFITWYILGLPHKARATWWFAAFFLGITIVAASIFLESSILVWGHLFFALRVVAALCAQASIIQFAYHFPHNDQPHEARALRRFFLLLVLLALAASSHYIAQSLAAPAQAIPFSRLLLTLLLPIGVLTVIAVLLRRMLHLHHAALPATARPRKFWPDLARALAKPASPPAAAMRTFGVVLLFGFIPAGAPLLRAADYIPTFAAAYIVGLGILLVQLALFLVFLDHIRAPSSVITRTFSIALVLLLALFGVVTLLLTSTRSEQFRQARQWQLAAVQHVLLRSDFADVPTEVIYIIAAPLTASDEPRPAYRQLYPDNTSQDVLQFITRQDQLQRAGVVPAIEYGRTLEALRELLTLPDQPGILRYTQQPYATSPGYVGYRFTEAGTRYEIGFRLADDLRAINRENLYLIILLLASSLILWLSLRFFLYTNLLQPLTALLGGIRQANAGNLTLNLPVQYEDEIGFLTHNFNSMVATLRETNTRLEQHVSARTAELTHTNMQLLRAMSERERIEAALHKSEEKYRSVSERANDGIAILQDSLIKYCNTRLASMLDYTVEDLQGQPFVRFIVPEQRDMVWQRFQQRMQGQHVTSRYEVALLHKERHRLAVEINASFMDYEGQGAVLAFVRDITERKQAEEALRQREQQYRLLAENMQDVVWTLSLEGRFTYVSPSVYALRGYMPEEVLQQSLDEVLTPASLQLVQESMQHDIGSESHQIARLELEQPCKDGTTVWTECIATSLLDDAGNLCGWVGVSRDISDRRRAAHELQHAKEHAEAANRAKSSFLANMSHELRTPLNAILGFAQIMRDSEDLPDDHRDYAGIIQRSGEHLLQLINSVLHLSKIEAGHMTLTPGDVDVYGLLADLENMFRLRVQDKGVLLIFERAPDIPQYVRTDEVKLRQVLINLLSNAVKFTQQGSVTLRVSSSHASSQHDGQHEADTHTLLFEVEDTGIGIAAEQQQHIFEAFSQTSSGQQTHGGTGLGLAISRSFVHLLGGDIAVWSEPGQGSLFSFSVPCTRVAFEDSPTSSAQPSIVGLAPEQPTYRILVVDDRSDTRLLLGKLLPPHGFALREAVNGQEALEVWRAWQPHLIFMDMRMPVLDGYEATQHIKAAATGKYPVIIALTASAFEEERAHMLAIGCDDFIRKPFRTQEIFDALAQHLGVRYLYPTETDSSTDHPPPAAASSTSNTDAPQTPGPASVLPRDVLVHLHQTIMLGDIDRLGRLIERVQGYDAVLAQTLATLAEDFQYDQIFLLLKAYEQADEPDSAGDSAGNLATEAQEKTPAEDRGRYDRPWRG